MKLQSITLWAVFFFLLTMNSSPVFADVYHDTSSSSRTITVKNTDSNIALAGLQFDWSTQALQLSGGVGSDNSLAIGMGKRFGEVLLNGSVSSQGAGLGFTLRLK